MHKAAFILLVIIFTGCTHPKVYRYCSSSVLANSDISDSATVTYDSVSIIDIKPGYYYKRIPADTTIEKIDYNEIDWIYVTSDNKVKLFLTANYEYCMLEMWWKNEPKEIYRQIKKNQRKFHELYLECENQEFVPSKIKKNNDAIIVLHPLEGDIIDSDELLFVKGGLRRKIRSYHEIISMDEYTFIGK